MPPAIPTSFTADNATEAVPVANNLNLLSRDTTDDNLNGIQTTADPNGSDDLYVELTNRITGAATTVGATTENMIIFSLGASAAVYRFDILITARDLGTNDGAGYSIFASAKTDGATASIIETPFQDVDADVPILGALATVTTAGNNFILQISGVAGQTISFRALAEYIVI